MFGQDLNTIQLSFEKFLSKPDRENSYFKFFNDYLGNKSHLTLKEFLSNRNEIEAEGDANSSFIDLDKDGALELLIYFNSTVDHGYSEWICIFQKTADNKYEFVDVLRNHFNPIELSFLDGGRTFEYFYAGYTDHYELLEKLNSKNNSHISISPFKYTEFKVTYKNGVFYLLSPTKDENVTKECISLLKLLNKHGIPKLKENEDGITCDNGERALFGETLKAIYCNTYNLTLVKNLFDCRGPKVFPTSGSKVFPRVDQKYSPPILIS